MASFATHGSADPVSNSVWFTRRERSPRLSSKATTEARAWRRRARGPPSASQGWLAPGYRGDDVFKSVGQFTITCSAAPDAAPAGRRRRNRLPSALGAY